MGDDVGTEVLATHESAEETCSSISTMNNAEVVEDKKVNFTAKQSPVGAKGNRKALKSESFEGKKSELGKNLDLEQCKKRHVQMKKSRGGNEMKSDSAKLRKMKSEPRLNLEDGIFKNSLQIVKAKSLAPPRKIVIDENMNKSDVDGRIQESTNSECKDITSNEEQITNKNLEIKDQNQNQKPNKENNLLPRNDTSPPILPLIPAAKIHPKRVWDNSHGNPSKIQSLGEIVSLLKWKYHQFLISYFGFSADLIMWRDVSRSTFVFGIGSFAIISSSYTKDLNISLISLLSYLGLVYLGVSFIFKPIITRGSMDMDNINEECVVGEEEAIWVVKLFLPYVNEFLVKLRALFSGDPPTTIKLAVLLFIIARCGGSITIWKMTKFGFFGVFMVPKLCSSYSSHLAAYGSFWIRRFGDAWESCSHKKAVGLGILTLLWNQSSVVGRIWGLFLLFVAFKYYVSTQTTSNSERTSTRSNSKITTSTN